MILLQNIAIISLFLFAISVSIHELAYMLWLDDGELDDFFDEG